MSMMRKNALALLGLPDGAYDAEAVAAAFRRAVVAAHPDTGGAGGNMSELQEARKALLQISNDDEFACKQCAGRGTVRYKLGVRPCGACKGTGETNGRKA